MVEGSLADNIQNVQYILIRHVLNTSLFLEVCFSYVLVIFYAEVN